MPDMLKMNRRSVGTPINGGFRSSSNASSLVNANDFTVMLASNRIAYRNCTAPSGIRKSSSRR